MLSVVSRPARTVTLSWREDPSLLRSCPSAPRGQEDLTKAGQEPRGRAGLSRGIVGAGQESSTQPGDPRESGISHELNRNDSALSLPFSIPAS